ncbi:fimbrillin family protein [Sphingobacterium sp. LRF_L2]|uniref:fimbrillin family protein n=1 Tax=Sphingobacterium sp. LRF_L2 TaxID=3369421 RepID=UPI003F5F3B71
MYKIVYFLLGVFSLSGCKQQDDLPMEMSDVALKISAQVANIGINNSNVWVDADELGLFMMTSGQSDLSTALEYNRKYTYSAAGADFILSGQPIYYPNTGAVDLVAYAPYGQVNGNTLLLDLLDQHDVKAIDLLYANNNIGIAKRKEGVDLNFKHMLSKINFSLTAGSAVSPEALSSAQISLEGFSTEATFNLATGALANVQASSTVNVGINRTAILLPHSGTSGRVLIIQLGGQQMNYTFPVTDAFEQGKEYNYTITVKSNEIEVQRTTITDWQIIGQVTETEPVAADLVWIPEGSFLMGSPNTDTDASANEKPQHWVRFEKGFYMSKYLVTIQDYCDFINASNVTIPSSGYIANVPLNGNWVRGFVANNQYNVPRYNGTKWVPPAGFEHYPMMLLTFDGALAYAKWAGGTLPTEAQWEYACRSGTATRWSFGDDENQLASYAWYNQGSSQFDVGSKLPNPWGLYDMHGLVAEYCFSAGDYPSAAQNEADALLGPGPANEAEANHAFRGGSYDMTDFRETHTRAAYRSFREASYFSNMLGFRIVINP